MEGAPGSAGARAPSSSSSASRGVCAPSLRARSSCFSNDSPTNRLMTSFPRSCSSGAVNASGGIATEQYEGSCCAAIEVATECRHSSPSASRYWGSARRVRAEMAAAVARASTVPILDGRARGLAPTPLAVSDNYVRQRSTFPSRPAFLVRRVVASLRPLQRGVEGDPRSLKGFSRRRLFLGELPQEFSVRIIHR